MSSRWQKQFSLSSSVSRYSYCKCARTKSRATSRVRMCSREWARRLRRFSRPIARYAMRENRWYTRPLRRKERACGVAFAKELLGEGHALVPAFGLRELQKLAHGVV